MSVCAQNYANKPYLEIYNPVSGKTYRMKPDKIIYIAIKDEKELKKTRIKKMLNDSLLVLRNHDSVYLSDIAALSFRSEKPRRTFEQISYVSFYAGFLWVVTYDFSVPKNDPGVPFFTPIVFFMQPFWALATELTGVLVKYSTTPRIFYKDKNMRLKIIQ